VVSRAFDHDVYRHTNSSDRIISYDEKLLVFERGKIPMLNIQMTPHRSDTYPLEHSDVGNTSRDRIFGSFYSFMRDD
jgi:hypothetical protein